MTPQLLPGALKKALDLLKAHPTRAWTIGEIALACGVGHRTLQRHFRRFLRRMPMEFLRELRHEKAREELLRGASRASVTEIAVRSGFNHVGRFATQYRVRYGESPSATLRRSQDAFLLRAGPLRLAPMAIDRPAIAVLPFDLIGPDARRAAGINEEIAAALMRLGWIAVTLPAHARYHLRGKVRDDGARHLRVTVALIDVSAGRYLWADRWDSHCNDVFDLEERVAARIAGAIQPPVREAEVHRAGLQDEARLNAWGLTMRALPRVLSVEAVAEELALGLLGQAMELAPCDPLPISLAAWCHGLRGGHNLCRHPDKERAAASNLARRAEQLNTGDPLTETLLAAGYTLAHDLATAAMHADRALALDGGSAWAWGRSGWIKAYGGEGAEAIERFQIARALAPVDPLHFLCSVGIAAGHFWAARYSESARWFEQGLLENPGAVWINHYLTAANALAGRKAQARRGLTELARAFPDLTIAQVRSGLPFRADFIARVAEGLESAGMRAF
jgi:AraC-like DNA-binding protein/TolB-like protein